MQQIWKFPLAITRSQNISVPQGAKFLSCQLQGNELCAYAMVSPLAKLKTRTINIVITADSFDVGDMQFLASVQSPASLFAWHVFISPFDK